MPFATKNYDYGTPFTQVFDNTGGSMGNLVLYAGKADPGASQASAKWQIYKVTYDANDSISGIAWAGGNTNFDKIWASRTTYAYS